MSERGRVVRYLIGRIRNDLRAVSHIQRSRVQVKLLNDVKETLSLLEVEVLKSESATRGEVKCDEVEKDQAAASG